MTVTHIKTVFKNSIFWTGLFLLLAVVQSKHDFNLDNGIILEGAWNLINHRHLYTDFFEIIAPGSFFLIAGIWKLIGVSYWSARGAAILSIYAASIGMYKASKRCGTSPRSAYVSPMLFIIASFQWPIITHNVFFLAPAIWAVYFFLKALQKPNGFSHYLICGVFIGLSILFLQQKGVALLVALLICLMWPAKSDAIAGRLRNGYALIIGSVICIALLCIAWPIPVLYANLISPILTYGQIVHWSWGILALFGGSILLSMWLFRQSRDARIWTLLIVQSILFVIASPNANLTSMTLILFPMYMLAPVIFRSWTQSSLPEKIVIAPVFILSFGMTLLFSLYGISHPARPLTPSKYISDDVINTYCPGTYIYAGPWMPQAYFETRKLNATPYYILLKKFQPDEDFKIAEERMEAVKPSCALVDYESVKKFGHTGNNDNSFERYLWKKYQPRVMIQGIIIMTRK